MRNCVLLEAFFYFFNFANVLSVVPDKAIFTLLSHATNENITASAPTSEVILCLNNPILFYKATETVVFGYSGKIFEFSPVVDLQEQVALLRYNWAQRWKIIEFC